MKNYFDENNELTEEGQKWMDKLNKYSEKCEKINSATCYESDQEVAESIKNIGNKNSNNSFELER